MAKLPTAKKSQFQPEDAVILRGKVTIIRDDRGREWVTILVRGFEQMPITVPAEYVERAPE